VSKIQEGAVSSPWDALVRELQSLPDLIPWNDVVTQDMFDVLTARSTRDLVYGIVHPADVKRALDKDRAQYITGAPEAIKYRLNVPTSPPSPDNESYFQWTEQTVRAFEQRAGALPLPPPQLLGAGVVRVRVSRAG
jgi:hypothetical protein